MRAVAPLLSTPPAQTVWQAAGVADDGVWQRAEFWREKLRGDIGPFGWDGPWRIHKQSGRLKLHQMYVPLLFDLTKVLDPFQMDIALEGEAHPHWTTEASDAISDALHELIYGVRYDKLIQYAEAYWRAREANL